LHCPQAMPGDVEHIVDAAQQPEVAVLVDARAVAGEVHAVGPAAAVLLHKALGIPVDAAQHRRPRLRDGEEPSALLDTRALRIPKLGADAGEGTRRRAWNGVDQAR